MRVLVSGASGLIGGALVPALEAAGHDVRRLVRRPARTDREVSWDPEAGRIDTAGLHGIEAVVHLAGASVAAGRWTAAVKQRIRDSRVRGTRLLVQACAALEVPPARWVGASAVGYYGDRGAVLLDEDSLPGSGFLAEVCEAWETETRAAAAAGTRVAIARIGMVLARHGGALPRMRAPLRWGIVPQAGDGLQFVSWITLDDVVRALQFALESSTAPEVFNAVAPEPIPHALFVRTLRDVHGRGIVLPAPGFVLRLVLGEMAEALLLASARVIPRRLREAGFIFQHADLRAALAGLLAPAAAPHVRGAAR